jgi:hypothetical protein
MQMKIQLHRKQGMKSIFDVLANSVFDRIRSDTDGWCPLNKISSTTYEYIQIDFDNLTVITLVELQGKFSLKPVKKTQRIEYYD